jgi:hypothetical protein
MNDTPRTEIYVLNPPPESVPADFARELERELVKEKAKAIALESSIKKVKYCLRMFDGAREAAQGTAPCKSRAYHADMFIEAVREALNP